MGHRKSIGEAVSIIQSRRMPTLAVTSPSTPGGVHLICVNRNDVDPCLVSCSVKGSFMLSATIRFLGT
ncbi:hypothetical protein FHS20_001525 [Phyllobacterium endophyticum]|nr:hypothetical protein [Phyllobacterium endophyticum]